MAQLGWKRLVAGDAWFRAPGHFPILAYSEFMPPPRLGQKPYGGAGPVLFDPADPFGWAVSEHEEHVELRPGLLQVARQVIEALGHVAQGRPARGIPRAKLENNVYWPAELAQRVGSLRHERYVVLSPLALSRTQDDKGRVRWTLFGSSEQGPERGFWQGFFTAPGREQPVEQSLDFVRRLLHAAYREPLAKLADLRRLGLRILPSVEMPELPYRPCAPLPAWTKPFMLADDEPVEGIKYVLTFRPFGSLPEGLRRAYLAGRLRLLPYPGSLVFWVAPPYLHLRGELPLAVQIALLPVCERHEALQGLRVPQSGWLYEHHPDIPAGETRHGVVRNTYRRTHRWARVHRHEDELAAAGSEDHMTHVLFSTDPQLLGLYDKPMARNAQIWTHDYRLLLDGPRAGRQDLQEAAKVLRGGGYFGYRFLFPAMHVARHEVYWHRPLVAYLSPETAQPEVLPDAPTGYLTAYRADRPELDHPVELWPRILAREPYMAVVPWFSAEPGSRRQMAAGNVTRLLDVWRLLGERPLPQSFAQALLTLPKTETLDQWLASLEKLPGEEETGCGLADEVRQRVEGEGPKNGGIFPEDVGTHRGRGAFSALDVEAVQETEGKRAPSPSVARGQRGRGAFSATPFGRTGVLSGKSPPSRADRATSPPLTFSWTARRSFEVAYWKTIARLAQGKYQNKDNGDCALDPVSQSLLAHHQRDLDALGDYLLAYHGRNIEKCGMAGKALVGELPFHWQTDFDFDWLGGWLDNQRQTRRERDLLVVIPGRDRRRAVIMADHYDTAYMEDVYQKYRGKKGARVAAHGADDNYSATAALMLAAPVFLELSRAGKLGCDVWLVHLTGEEFPADCMGARHLAQWIVEGTLKLHVDLSNVAVQGVYVLDMIAHDSHRQRVFQIAPGVTRESMWLACQAHLANMAWNAAVPEWNQQAPRRKAGAARRSADPAVVPTIARHPQLHGEVRPAADPRSTLFNTDGQIFSDAGVPVVLFMENYDINRHGYHDTKDTMANIDLDYGAGVAAIAIEAVARAACQEGELQI